MRCPPQSSRPRPEIGTLTAQGFDVKLDQRQQPAGA
jgi:hypothetical protein